MMEQMHGLSFLLQTLLYDIAMTAIDPHQKLTQQDLSSITHIANHEQEHNRQRYAHLDFMKTKRRDV